MPPNMLPNALIQFISHHKDYFEAIPNEIQALKAYASASKTKEFKPLVFPEDQENLQNAEDSENIIRPADILREIGSYATISLEVLTKSLEFFQKWTDEDLYLCLEVLAQDPSIKPINEDYIKRVVSLVFSTESNDSKKYTC